MPVPRAPNSLPRGALPGRNAGTLAETPESGARPVAPVTKDASLIGYPFCDLQLCRPYFFGLRLLSLASPPTSKTANVNTPAKGVLVEA